MKLRLIRNLKRGDKIKISLDKYSKVIEVLAVQETNPGLISRKRRWMICANYPWWWGMVPITGYYDTKIEVF